MMDLGWPIAAEVLAYTPITASPMDQQFSDLEAPKFDYILGPQPE